jgi:hypothetical protein
MNTDPASARRKHAPASGKLSKVSVARIIGTTKLALVVCDLLGLHRSVSIEARRLIQQATRYGVVAADLALTRRGAPVWPPFI